MKNFFFQIGAVLICSMFLFTACETDDDDDNNNNDTNTTDNCGDVSSSVVSFYEDDALRLAIQQANASGGATSGSILVPPGLVDKMSDVLTAVHASEFIARDSIVDVYDVHIHKAFELDRFFVDVNTDTTGNAWVQNWLNGYQTTGNVQIDALVTNFSLEIDDLFVPEETGQTAKIILKTDENINVDALITQFNFIDGVENAGKSRDEFGDGDDITVTTIAGETTSYNVVYKVAYEGCQDAGGCQKARFYEFNVSDNCNVTYVQTYGDEAPEDTDPEDRHE